MSTNSKLQTAIHLALGLSAGALAASYAPLAVAQDQDAQDVDEDTIEEVIVTVHVFGAPTSTARVRSLC